MRGLHSLSAFAYKLYALNLSQIVEYNKAILFLDSRVS